MKHSKPKRILAIIGVALLAGLYLSTLVFAFIDTELSQQLLKVSFICTLIIPVLLYVFLQALKWFGPDKKDNESQN